MKRLLLITYYFPPSGGPGVQRSLKFVKYLPLFDWEITVLTVDPEYAAYPDLDPDLADEIPDGTRIIRTKAWDPYAAYARILGVKKEKAVGVGFLSRRQKDIRETLARWIRANIFLPDARVGWVSHARAAALEETIEVRYDAVVSSGPPHSTHLVARSVKARTGLPWIMDLRDAWPPDSYQHLLPMTRLARAVDRRFRRKSFEAADRLLTVSDSLKQDLAALTDVPVDVIPNGYDSTDFDAPEPNTRDEFTIVYTGNLSAEQNPIALWKALQERTTNGDWANLRVTLVGHVAVEVLDAIDRAGVRDGVEIVPYVPHHEAIRYMCGASLLLLCINRVPNPTGIITGKLFEYLASGRPVLCLSPGDTEAGSILKQSGAGRVFGYDDVSGVSEEIDRHYTAAVSGAPLTGAEGDRILRYSRRAQAEHLAALLDRLTHKAP